MFLLFTVCKFNWAWKETTKKKHYECSWDNEAFDIQTSTTSKWSSGRSSWARTWLVYVTILCSGSHFGFFYFAQLLSCPRCRILKVPTVFQWDMAKSLNTRFTNLAKWLAASFHTATFGEFWERGKWLYVNCLYFWVLVGPVSWSTFTL